MKKIFYTYFFLVFFTFSTSSHAKDITDYEINGVSIGQSLLDYLSEDEIFAEIERNKPTYNYLNSDFGEVYLTLSSDEYDFMSVFVKPNDKRPNKISIIVKNKKLFFIRLDLHKES